MNKRIFDILFSLFFILFFWWIFLIISILIYFKDGFPILYFADRKGANKKIFTCFKFRSMSNHIEAKKRNITTLGHFIRNTNLDETPQFFNILRGDMSVVGPRPHDIGEDMIFEKNIPNYNQRFNTKPGLTGYAAIMGNRGGNDIEKIKERTKLDLYYIENQSILFDIEIILKTAKLTISNIYNRLF